MVCQFPLGHKKSMWDVHGQSNKQWDTLPGVEEGGLEGGRLGPTGTELKPEATGVDGVTSNREEGEEACAYKSRMVSVPGREKWQRGPPKPFPN